MFSGHYRLFVIACASISLSGCAALGQFGDNVWSHTHAFGAKTQKQIVQLLRPAPKADYVFEDTSPVKAAEAPEIQTDTRDATLNISLLEQRVFDLFEPEAPEEDARIRFVAEIPDLRPAPSFTASLLDMSFETSIDEASKKDGPDLAKTRLAKRDMQAFRSTYSPISVEELDPVKTPIAPHPKAQPSVPAYDDLILAGGPDSPELEL